MSLKVFLVSTNVFLGAKFCEKWKKKQTLFHIILFFLGEKNPQFSKKKKENFVTFEVQF
jgi:hypothetical protein